jgi:hypothetical protein
MCFVGHLIQASSAAGNLEAGSQLHASALRLVALDVRLTRLRQILQQLLIPVRPSFSFRLRGVPLAAPPPPPGVGPAKAAGASAAIGTALPRGVPYRRGGVAQRGTVPSIASAVPGSHAAPAAASSAAPADLWGSTPLGCRHHAAPLPLAVIAGGGERLALPGLARPLRRLGRAGSEGCCCHCSHVSCHGHQIHSRG